MSEVLPAPEGPVRNWNERGGIWKLTSRRISGPIPYLRPTFSKRITGSASLHCPQQARAGARLLADDIDIEPTFIPYG
ncbi:hypothetical protein [Brucella neotomae]|uniref:hypothetical protein n=1 Tax=Brucella neotomae TaxID=29460 RepID=UPI001495C6B5|nr:hypothetical protein [Brucella neotomae]